MEDYSFVLAAVNLGDNTTFWKLYILLTSMTCFRKANKNTKCTFKIQCSLPWHVCS